MQIYSVTVMTHVKALQAGHSSQGTSEPITPVFFSPVFSTNICPYYYGPWAYGLHTTNPGPIITNGMGPVSE